jgi:hypothetical protein
MISVLHDSILEVDKNVSVNDIILQNIENPISDEEYQKIEEYYLNLKKVGLIDLIQHSHYYDVSKYDFYFVIGDASSNWYRKLIFNTSTLDLVLKYKIINFVVHKYYGRN